MSEVEIDGQSLTLITLSDESHLAADSKAPLRVSTSRKKAGSPASSDIRWVSAPDSVLSLISANFSCDKSCARFAGGAAASVLLEEPLTFHDSGRFSKKGRRPSSAARRSLGAT